MELKTFPYLGKAQLNKMKKQMKIKNSAVDLTDLALGIVILGIVVSVGANILIGVRDSQLTDLPVLTTTNETVTSPAVDTASPLTNIWGITVTDCYNSSSDTQIEAANFTSSVDGFGIISVTPASTATEWIGGDWLCSYTRYDTTEPNWALANDAAEGLAEYGDWFDIIVIVGIAAVIIALIFMAFGRGGSTSGSGGLGGSY